MVEPKSSATILALASLAELSAKQLEDGNSVEDVITLLRSAAKTVRAVIEPDMDAKFEAEDLKAFNEITESVDAGDQQRLVSVPKIGLKIVETPALEKIGPPEEAEAATKLAETRVDPDFIGPLPKAKAEEIAAKADKPAKTLKKGEFGSPAAKTIRKIASLSA